MTAPRIGVTGLTRTVSGAERSLVNAAYVRSVTRAGGIPLILSPLIDTGHTAELLDAIAGLMLTGGEDVDPACYGQPRHPRLGNVDPARDAFELALFRAAWDRGLPVLAICRGIQLVNVALGGTLWQDIPSQRPEALPHDQPSGRDDRTHPVGIQPGSRLARALGVTRCDVNSFHHQSIRDLAPGLIVTGQAPDGEIEGVESGSGLPWLLAVQWHPEEFHHDGGAPDQGLFAALLREAASGVRQPPPRAAAGTLSEPAGMAPRPGGVGGPDY
jgi:putative glutamine amidotransferase